ncbi:MAG: class I SAM-dependent methyltransferase [Actinomycetota bacterium]
MKPGDLDETNRKVRRLWGEMAPEWERRRDFLKESTSQLTGWMIAKLAPRPGEVIVDLAAGAGDVGFRFASDLGSTGKLISSDFAPEMLEAARRVAADLGISNAEFQVLDAQNNALPDRSVDGVVCRWGFMLMPDPQAALKETHRILKDGGRLVFAVMADPAVNPWGSIVVKTLVDLGLADPVDPTAPGNVFSLSNQSKVEELLSKAGFTDVEIEEQPVTFAFKDFGDYWSFLTEFAGAVAYLLLALPPQDQKRVAKELENRLEPYRKNGGYVLPGRAVGAVAS